MTRSQASALAAPSHLYIVTGVDGTGQPFAGEPPRPEHQIGDALHFSEGASATWQLRPLTTHDMIEGVSYQPGTWMLVKRVPRIGALRAYLKLPYRLRRNTPAAASEAYRRLSAPIERSARHCGILRPLRDPRGFPPNQSTTNGARRMKETAT